MEEVPQPPTIMKSTTGAKKIIRKGKLIGFGGFSEVFNGDLVVEKIPIAVKVIKKQPFVQWKRVTSLFIRQKKNPAVQTAFSDALSNGNGEPQAVSATEGPKCLPRREINREIKSLKRFQKNKFVLKLLGVVNFLTETWIVTELCFYHVEKMLSLCKDFMESYDSGQMVAHLLAPILNALLFIHATGYIHRDIKLMNIVVNRDGVPKLIDFGMCVKLSAEKRYSAKHRAGSPYYMAAEIVRKLPLGMKCDAFAFALAVVNLHFGKKLSNLFGDRSWDEVVEIYLERGESQKELQKCIDDNVLGSNDVICSEWEDLGKDLVKLLHIDEADRGTLEDLAANPAFKRSMEDWNKYPCDQSLLSKRFLRQQGFIAASMAQYGEATPLLLEYKQK